MFTAMFSATAMLFIVTTVTEIYFLIQEEKQAHHKFEDPLVDGWE